MSVATALKSGAGQVAWFVRGVLGEDAYQKYVEHHRAVHGDNPAVPMMSEREFWRDKTDRQEANPQGRCC